MMGTTVVVEHGGGLTSTYANLASVPTVAVGDTVGAGSVLGSVGGTAIAESALASHLHFSMSLDGSTVDPWNTCPTKFFPSFPPDMQTAHGLSHAPSALYYSTSSGKRPGRAARPPAR